MKCIIGLGNYPTKYDNTRHNFGFIAINLLAKKYQLPEWKYDKKFMGEITQGNINGEKTILLKPHTYMNLSGKSVLAVKNFYKIELENLLAVYDDLALDFGVTRFREKGSHGGHNGVRSMIEMLGTDHFMRLKLGINNPQKESMPTENFVLSRFSKDEEKQISEIIKAGLLKINY